MGKKLYFAVESMMTAGISDLLLPSLWRAMYKYCCLSQTRVLSAYCLVVPAPVGFVYPNDFLFEYVQWCWHLLVHSKILV